jgi:hypothetical protein
MHSHRLTLLICIEKKKKKKKKRKWQARCVSQQKQKHETHPQFRICLMLPSGETLLQPCRRFREEQTSTGRIRMMASRLSTLQLRTATQQQLKCFSARFVWFVCVYIADCCAAGRCHQPGRQRWLDAPLHCGLEWAHNHCRDAR